jgi:cytoskeletal protein RodZ
MATLGERLRQARERAGLSVDDLSARTKIQVSLLTAIERDDFNRVPGGLFVRGFLRAYAREVDLDPESVVTDYLDQVEPEPPAPDDAVRPHADAERDVILAQPDFQGFSWRRVWPALGAAGAILVVFYVFGSGSGPRPQPVVEAQLVGTGGTIEPRPASERPQQALPETMTLDLRAKRDVWVAATGDGTRVMYRILKAGEQAAITARQEITARIGDAEALEYSVNGVAGEALGEPGEVRDILMTPGSFRSLKVLRPKPPEPPQSPGNPG